MAGSEEAVRTECDSLKVDDEEKSNTLRKCDSCCETFEIEDMFKCSTCMDNVDDATAVEFHCEACILPHVRKGHEILDHKYLKAALCGDHKNLCSLFCSNCEEVLCLNCVSKHLGHGMIPLKAKAVEVRMKVFELISELDRNEKIVRKTKERLTKDQEKYNSGIEDLIQKVSDQFDQMKQEVLDRIKNEHDKFVNAGKESEDNLDLLLKCESDLRELLSRSIGDLIIEYPKVKQATAAVDKTQAKLNEVLIEEKMHSIASDTLEPLAREFTNTCWEKIQMPIMKNASAKIFVPLTLEFPNLASSEPSLIERLESHFSWLRLSHNHFINFYSKKKLLTIASHGNEVRVYQMSLVQTMSSTVIARRNGILGKFVAAEQVQKLLVIPQAQIDEQRILILTDRHVLKFDPNSNIFSYTTFDPPINHIPLMIVSLVENVEYVYWDSDNRKVCQTNKESVEINCSSLPTLKTTYGSRYFFFVNDLNKIVRFDTEANGQPDILVINESDHRVKQIDCVSDLSHLKRDSFVIWSLASQTLTFMRCNEVLIVASFFTKLKLISGVFTGNTAQFLVIADIETESQKNIQKEIFMVRTA